MPAALRPAADQADRRAVAGEDDVAGGGRGGERVGAAHARREAQGRAGVGGAVGVGGDDGRGAHVVRPQAQRAGAGAAAEEAVVRHVRACGAWCCRCANLLMAGAADDEADVVLVGELDAGRDVFG